MIYDHGKSDQILQNEWSMITKVRAIFALTGKLLQPEDKTKNKLLCTLGISACVFHMHATKHMKLLSKCMRGNINLQGSFTSSIFLVFCLICLYSGPLKLTNLDLFNSFLSSSFSLSLKFNIIYYNYGPIFGPKSGR